MDGDEVFSWYFLGQQFVIVRAVFAPASVNAG
jgi:hypothetical protein